MVYCFEITQTSEVVVVVGGGRVVAECALTAVVVVAGKQLTGQRDAGGRKGSLKRKHDSLIASFWVEALSRKQPFLSDCRVENKHVFFPLLSFFSL